MAITPLTIPARSYLGVDPPADVNALAAKVNELAVANGVPPVSIPTRQAGVGARDLFRQDMNALRAKIDAICSAMGVADTGLTDWALGYAVNGEHIRMNALVAKVNELISTSLAPPPAPVISLSNENGDARLTWTVGETDSPITSFRVERSRALAAYATLTSPGATTFSYLDVNAEDGDRYRMVAINAIGTSGLSNVVTFTAATSAGIADTFGRSGDLGADWTQIPANSYLLANSEVSPTSTFGSAARHVTAPTGESTYAELRWRTTLAAAGGWAGPTVNMSPLGADLGATDPFYILSVTGAGFTTLGIRRKNELTSATTNMKAVTLTTGVAAGDLLRLESTATELIGYVNGIERIRVAKSTLAALPNPAATGVGWWTYGSTEIRLDDFKAGGVGTGGGTAPTPPAAPVLTSPHTNITSGSFTSSWSNVAAADSYLVQRRTGTNAFETVATVTDEVYTHTGLVSATAYDVRIISVAGSLQSTPSNTVSATTGAAVTPGTPVLASPATNISSSGFLSTWSAAANATDYLVQRRQGTATFATVATTTNLTYQHSGLSAESSYDVRVIARAGTTQGTASNTVTTTTAAAAVVTPPATGDRFMIGMSDAQIKALPMSGAGWTNIVTQSGSASTALAVNMNDQGSYEASKAVACALRYVRTGDVGYKNKVIAGCEAVRTWSGSTYRTAYFRQMAGWVIASDLVGHKTSAWMTFLDTIRYRTTWTTSHSRWFEMYTTAWDSANNHGVLSAASFLACSLAIGDTAQVTEATGWIKCVVGDQSQHGTHASEGSPTPGAFRPNSGGSLSWTYGTPWIPINPTSAPATLEGAYSQDIARENTSYSVSGGVPVWGSAGKSYTEASSAGFMVSAMLVRANRLDTAIFTKGSNALRRWKDYLNRYGDDNHTYSGTTFVDQIMNHVYGTSYTGVDAAGWNFTGGQWLRQSATWLKD